MKAYKDKQAKAEGAQATDKGDSVLGKKKQKESGKPAKVEKEAAKAAPASKGKADDKKAKTPKVAAPKVAKQTKTKKASAGEEVNAEEKKVEKPKAKPTPVQQAQDNHIAPV